jgi:hypothetical protein
LRQDPILDGIFEVSQLRLGDGLLAQSAEKFDGPLRLARFEQLPQFRQALSSESESKRLRGGIGRRQGFCLKQIVPGRRRIALPQMALTAFDVPLRELLQKSPRFAMAADRWLAQELLGFLKPPVLQGRSGLSECQPAAAEHGANP